MLSVQEMLNARDRYRAAPYETSCSRIYVRHIREGTGLSVVLSVTGRQARREAEVQVSYRRWQRCLSCRC